MVFRANLALKANLSEFEGGEMSLPGPAIETYREPSGLQPAPPIQAVPAEADSFVRIEDKYLVRQQLAGELFRLLESRLDLSFPDPSTQFTLIESRYFDTDGLDIYKTHFSTLSQRFKLRVRKYGPNGNWREDSMHLELKAKQLGVTEKHRFRIGPEESALLEEGNPIPLTRALRHRNSRMEAKTFLRRFEAINDVVQNYRLRPSCRIQYRRKAYERDGLRVTVDDGIEVQLLSPIRVDVARQIIRDPLWERASEMRQLYLSEDCIVVEVKHPGQSPQWIQDFMASAGAAKASFSKYCFGLTQHLGVL
jgi:SPX domain protein involved in polyphosphate accumulation